MTTLCFEKLIKIQLRPNLHKVILHVRVYPDMFGLNVYHVYHDGQGLGCTCLRHIMLLFFFKLQTHLTALRGLAVAYHKLSVAFIGLSVHGMMR